MFQNIFCTSNIAIKNSLKFIHQKNYKKYFSIIISLCKFYLIISVIFDNLFDKNL